jgi:hypothetical protein
MENKEHTAVEWLNQMLVSKGIFFEYELYQQAKAMEKEQIIDAYKYGNQSDIYFKPEQYYDETYGK